MNKNILMILVLLLLPTTAIAEDFIVDLSWITDGFNALVNAGQEVYDLIFDIASFILVEIWLEFGTWLGLILFKFFLSVTVFLSTVAFEVAKEILVEYGVTGWLENAWNELTIDAQNILKVTRVTEAIQNLITEYTARIVIQITPGI